MLTFQQGISIYHWPETPYIKHLPRLSAKVSKNSGKIKSGEQHETDLRLGSQDFTCETKIKV